MNSKDLSFQEKLFMVGTSLVAGFALLVSLWQGYETRRHNRLSVKPILGFDRNFYKDATDSLGGKKYQLVIKNMGFGPAIIKKFDLYLDNKKLEKEEYSIWNSAIKQGKLGLKLLQASTLSDGDLIKNSFSKSIIKSTFIKEDLKRLNLKIHYQSIYEEDYYIEIQLY